MDTTGLPKERFTTYFVFSFLVTLLLLSPVIIVQYDLCFSAFFSKLIRNEGDMYNTIKVVQDISITVSVGLFGFFLTSLAIIVSFFDNSKMQAFGKTEGLLNLLSTYKYAFIGIIGSVTATLFSVIFYIPDVLILFLLILFLIYNIFSASRCVTVLFMIIKNIAHK